jgi:hypothetical protein
MGYTIEKSNSRSPANAGEEEKMARYRPPDSQWGGPRSGAGRPVQGIRTRNISITLPEDLLAKVDQVAQHTGEFRSTLIAHYLRKGLDQPEEETAPQSNT